jgi:transaldolase
MEMKNIKILKHENQSIWIDFISKELIKSGQLEALINKGITGLTSNPSIFEKAISKSTDYDEDIKFLLQKKTTITSYEIFEELSITDIKDAASLLLETYEQSDELDGFVSIEVSPDLAYDSNKTIDQALHLNKKINMPNIMIKVPATQEGVKAIEILTSMGLNINATLMFNQNHYNDVANAFINGAKKCSNNQLPFSVASFFVSRVDTIVDKIISSQNKKSNLLGRVAILNSQLAYTNFLHKFPNQNSKPMQKPLWGSTSTKNKNYPDTLYIDKLIAPNSINTVPLETIDQFIDHGIPEKYKGWNKTTIEKEIEQLHEYNIDLEKITHQLQIDGVKVFQDAFSNMLKSIEKKSESIIN